MQANTRMAVTKVLPEMKEPCESGQPRWRCPVIVFLRKMEELTATPIKQTKLMMMVMSLAVLPRVLLVSAKKLGVLSSLADLS